MNEREWTDEEVETLITDSAIGSAARRVDDLRTVLRALVAQRKELRHEVAQAHGVGQACSQRIAGVEAERDRLAQKADAFLGSALETAAERDRLVRELAGLKRSLSEEEAYQRAAHAVDGLQKSPMHLGCSCSECWWEHNRNLILAEARDVIKALAGDAGTDPAGSSEHVHVPVLRPNATNAYCATCGSFPLPVSSTSPAPLSRAEAVVVTSGAVTLTPSRRERLLATDAALREACREAADLLTDSADWVTWMRHRNDLVAKLRRLAR